MNIEKWIDDNVFDADVDLQCVEVKDLLELLKTHAIVPREPSDAAILKGKRQTIEPIIGVEVCNIYKAMIKAAENEQ